MSIRGIRGFRVFRRHTFYAICIPLAIAGVAGSFEGLLNRSPSSNVQQVEVVSNPFEVLKREEKVNTGMMIKKIKDVCMYTYSVIDGDIFFEDTIYDVGVLKSIGAGKIVKKISGYFGRKYSVKFLLTLDLSKITMEAGDNIINIKYDKENLPIIVSYKINKISPIEYDESEGVPFIEDFQNWIVNFVGKNNVHAQGRLKYTEGLDFIMNACINRASDEIEQRLAESLLAEAIGKLQKGEIELGEGVPEVLFKTGIFDPNIIIEINGTPIEELASQRKEDIEGKNITLYEGDTIDSGLMKITKVDGTTREEFEKQRRDRSYRSCNKI